MPANRIWTGFDADVFIYLSNSQGQRLNAGGTPWVPSDGPYIPYCYFQNCTLDGEIAHVRRPVTGRPQRRILMQALECELSVDHFYLGKQAELDLTKVFHREQYLEIVLRLLAPEDLATEDLHTLSIARATSFHISTSSTSNVQGSAHFVAEKFA